MYRYPNYWICQMERFCLKAADMVISPSHYMVKELNERAALGNRGISIVPNPFDSRMAGMEEMPEEVQKPDQIVFFGKLTVQKGAFRLFKYFQELWDQGFKRPLYVIGGQDIVYHPEGRTMGDIIRKKYRKYIDQGLLILEDRIPRSEIAARLAKAEVAIIPSDNDNLPYVVFEMMALGRIVLASLQGGQSEVIEDGVDGFVFDHNEPESFGKQLHHILGLSPEERQKIKTNARQKVNTVYHSSVIYEKKMQVLQPLLKKNNRPGNEFPFLAERFRNTEPVRKENEVKGLLSIVVPYYNMGAYIDDTISSLRNIHHSNREIIIVNDGSNEEQSLRKLNSFRNVDGIRVIDTENKGLAHARNIGAETAKGEWMAFLDADDTVDPSYYSWAIDVLSHYDNVHFVGSWVKYFGNSDRIWPAFTPEPPIILNQNTVNSSALVYKRAAFLAGGMNDRKMLFQGFEDYASVISMLDHGFGGVVIPEPLFNYRVRNQSMFRVMSKSKKLNLYHHMSRNHAAFYGKYAVDLFNLLNANGPGIETDNPSLDYHLADNLPFGGRLSRQIIALVKKNRYVKTMAYKAYKMIKK